MTQNEINRAVREATGESIREIQRRGFSLVDLDEVVFDPEPLDRPPLVVDWDEVDYQRSFASFDMPMVAASMSRL